MPERGEDPDVGTELDQDGAGGVMVDAGDGGQEVDLVPVRRQPLPDEGVVPADPLFGLGEGDQLVPQDEARMGGKVRVEGVAQFRHPAPDMAGEAGDDPVAALAGREAIEDAPTVGAEEVGQDPADPDAGTVEDLVGAGAQGGPVMEDLSPLA